MNILIRADGSKKIGYGHLMRITSLANELKAFASIKYLIARQESASFVESLGYDYDAMNFNSKSEKAIDFGNLDDIEAEIEFLKSYNLAAFDLVIIDSYNVNDRLFETYRKHVKVMFIDDIPLFKYSVDYILNYNIYAPDLYENFDVNHLLLGPCYFLSRSEFRQTFNFDVSPSLSTVMITMGGSDQRGMSAPIVRTIKEKYPELSMKVIVGPGMDKVKLLSDLADINGVTLIENASMSDEMMSSDLLISSSSSTLYEACLVGIPTLSITIADNQGLIGRAYHDNEVIESCGWYYEYEAFLISAIKKYKNHEERLKRSIAMKKLVSNNGAEQVCHYLRSTL